MFIVKSNFILFKQVNQRAWPGYQVNQRAWPGYQVNQRAWPGYLKSSEDDWS